MADGSAADANPTLTVLHWPVPGASLPEPDPSLAQRAWIVDTCLRRVAIAPGPPAADGAGAEIHAGIDGWRFALEAITGLHSAVAGESNVFGQFRSAWRTQSALLPAASLADLATIANALFADASAIRRTHLEGIGGHSYGSLVRRLLGARPGDRVLVIGTGKLARSILPFFAAFDARSWNRGPAVLARDSAVTFAPDAAAEAAQWASHVVFTTPADDGHDSCWAGLLAVARPARVVHLGRRCDDTTTAVQRLRTATLDYCDLDDVFNLAGQQAGLRAHRLARAAQACAAAAARRFATPMPATAASR